MVVSELCREYGNLGSEEEKRKKIMMMIKYENTVWIFFVEHVEIFENQ